MKHSRPLPSVEKLRNYFNYDRITGILRWIRVDNPKANQYTKVGDMAGSDVKGKGYLAVWFENRYIRVHRLIYCLVTGIDPGNNEVDHRNGNPSDNRWKNLRICLQSQNSQNHRIYKSNSTGVSGLHWEKATKRWTIYVVKDKRVYKRRFKEKEPALVALRELREQLHGEFTNHG